MGTPEFAVPSLEALVRSPDQMAGVVTQPDRPKGRGQVLTPPPIKLLSRREGLPFLQPAKMKDPAFLDALRAWQPDLIVVAAFGRILPPLILEIPPKGCINIHASLLPKYRGAAPIQWAVMNGERETGITTMLMDPGMDTGDVLLQERVSIDPDDTGGSLSRRLAEVASRLLMETIQRLKAGSLSPIPQDHAHATMAPLLKKEDGLIDWRRRAVEIANQVRGLSPWPGAYSLVAGERWTICGASVETGSAGTQAIGLVLRAGNTGIAVSTGDGTLVINELQPAGRRRMTAAQYLAGHPLKPGLVLGQGPHPGAED